MKDSIEDRWKNPFACNLCGSTEEGMGIGMEHISPPDFTFCWCKKCAKDRAACDAKIEEAVKAYYEWREKNIRA